MDWQTRHCNIVHLKITSFDDKSGIYEEDGMYFPTCSNQKKIREVLDLIKKKPNTLREIREEMKKGGD
jgi:hypothetical protein